MTGETKALCLGLCLALLICFAHVRSFGAELTREQRKIADALVAKRIQEIQSGIVERADLEANIQELAQRTKEGRGLEAVSQIGFCANYCRDAHVPIPEAINEDVVSDIVWQYENPHGFHGNDLKDHREVCARALGFIGHPKGVPTVLKSLEREGGHCSWQALEGISDERFISAIEEHLDFTCQQDASPAIKCLGRIGTPAIPTLRRFLEGQDRGLKREAAEALVSIGTPECIPLLEVLSKGEDRDLAAKAHAGILHIRCRAVDGICSPPAWDPEDESRLRHLTYLALFEEDAVIRSRATEAIVQLGEPAVWHVRLELPNKAHGGGSAGPHFFISERASDLLAQIGDPSVPALLDALCDERPHSRRSAAQALRRITGEAFDANYDDWKTWYLEQHGRSTLQNAPAHADSSRR